MRLTGSYRSCTIRWVYMVYSVFLSFYGSIVMAQAKFTRRQLDYLSTLLDIYRQAHEGVHHSEVAQRLGVSPVTAYEMLSLLEGHGLLTSEFLLPASGPGRSSLVFRPTARAWAAISEVGQVGPDADWETAKERLLAAVESGEMGNYTDLVEMLLQRLEHPRSSLFFVSDMLTAIILLLYQVAGRTAAPLLKQLRHIGLANEHGLNILNGLVLGLTLAERVNRTVVTRLMGKADAYTQALARLSPTHQGQLLKFSRELVQILLRKGGEEDAPLDAPIT